MKQFQSEKPDDRDTRMDDNPAMPYDPTNHAVAHTTQCVGDHWRTAEAMYPTDQAEQQATISDLLLLSRVRGLDENSHVMKVDTVRDPRDKHLSV